MHLLRFLALLLVIVGCRSVPVRSPSPYVPDIDKLAAHVHFLASDEFEGREAGTRGEQIAAKYLAAQLRQFGVRPFSYPSGPLVEDSMSYVQPFDAVKVTVLPSSGLTLVDSSTGRHSFMWFGEHFVNFHQYVVDGDFSGPMVFAGFGITAPEFQYDDYAGLDVKGRVVVVLDGEPYSDSEDFFFADIPSSYSSALYYKRHRAKELGASALIVLAYDKLLSRWSDYSSFFKSGKLVFKDDLAGFSDSTSLPFFYAGEFFFRLALDRIFSFDSLMTMARQGERLPVFHVPGRMITGQMRTKREPTRSENVVGVIHGRHPTLKDEYVVLGAHYDHLGVNTHGDIFNGADDNASGTSAVLEAARGLAQDQDLQRSVIVIFHGGEEKGLMGSEYFTNETTLRPVELSQMVCQINMDMVGRESEDSIFVIGSGRLSSELKSLSESVNRDLGLFHYDYTFDSEDDPNRYYYRSDHYNYARRGIPVAFFFDGMTVDYHKPSDDANRINYRKLEKATTLLYHLARRVGNLEHRLNVDAAP